MSHEAATKAVVIGREGCGTTFVARILAGHPRIAGIPQDWHGHEALRDGVTHISVPHGFGRKVPWPTPELVDVPGCRLVVVDRSFLDSTYSAYRRFYRPGSGRAAMEHQLIAVRVLQEIRDRMGPQRVFDLEYEGLGGAPWDELFGFLGWEPGHRPSEPFQTQNGKARQDPEFLRSLGSGSVLPYRVGEFLAGRLPRKHFRG